jgi:hypothetical protein
MTVIGFEVASSEQAYAWADAEVYAEGKPSGWAPKLYVNPLARMVFVGSGRIGIIRDAADDFSNRLSFDEAVDALPQTLRRAAHGFQALEIAARAPLTTAVIAVIGFSQRYGLAGFVFDSRTEFEPNGPCRSYMTPASAQKTYGAPDEQGIVSTASHQLEEIRRELPLATGGALVLAEINRQAVRAGPIFDLAIGKMLRNGWRPPAQETE